MLPLIEIHDETLIPLRVECIPERRGKPLHLAAERYRRNVAGMLTQSVEWLCVAYDPNLNPGEGNAGRRITLASQNRAVAHAWAEANVSPCPDDAVIVSFGPGFADCAFSASGCLELVAADMAAAVAMLHPIEAEGPIAAFVPHLAIIAGSVFLPGPAGAAERAERAVGRAYRALAQELYGRDNACAALVTDNPAWPLLAEEIGAEALHLAAFVDGPMSREMASTQMRQVISQTLVNLRVPVLPARSR